MSLGAIHWNNLTNFTLPVKQNTGFFGIKINSTTASTATVKYLIQIVQGIDLRDYRGELFADTRIIFLVFLGNNMGDLGIGHPRMGMHNRLKKLVASNITLGTDLHLTDHAQTIFSRI